MKLKYVRVDDDYRTLPICSQDMKEDHAVREQLPLPPNRLFERLAQIGSNYTWDQSIDPFHSVSFHLDGRLHLHERLTRSSSELRQLACLWNQV